MTNRVTNLVFDDYVFGDNGTLLYYLIDHHKISYKIKIKSNYLQNIIEDYPKHLRYRLHPYIINTGIGLLSFMIKKYYPKYIIINAVQLDKTCLKLWTMWFTKGLGEFFYKNKLPHRLTILTNTSKPFLKRNNFNLTNKALLPNGGGKDSIVSSELLKDIGLEYSWVTVGLTNYRKNVIDASDISSYLNISYIQYGKTPNEYKTYSGHIPYTLYTSCLICLVAGLTNMKYVVYSNEKSANFPNLTITEDGRQIDINHQYTKSYEFEKNYHYFLKTYVNKELEYFSILRHLYEIQIASVFSNFTKYHKVFVSCNWGKWCGKCSKCAFIYLSLYPYIDNNKLKSIIGNDMLNDKKLLKTYLELTGHKNYKPFECVGTLDENQLIMKLAINKSNAIGEDLFIINYCKESVPDIKYNPKLLTEYNINNKIPTWLKKGVRVAIMKYIEGSGQVESSNISEHFTTLSKNNDKASYSNFNYMEYIKLFIIIVVTYYIIYCI